MAAGSDNAWRGIKMQDYYHYEYICPYLAQVTAERISCEGGSCIAFRSRKDAKRYLRAYCCSDYTSCSVAKMLTDYWEGKDEDI